MKSPDLQIWRAPYRCASWLAVALLGLCIGAIEAAPPAAPTNFTATATGIGSFDLSWDDNATDEDSYRLDVRFPPEVAWTEGILSFAADSNNEPVNGPALAGTVFEFRVVAVNGDGASPSNSDTAITPDAFNSNLAPFAHILQDQPFSFDASATNGNGSTILYTATGLPPGLTIDPGTGAISGSATEDGYFPVHIEVTYTEPPSDSLEHDLALRIPPIPGPPVLAMPLPGAPLVALEPATNLPLDTYFADPDTRVAVKIDTTEGDMVFSLFDKAMPTPVANFLVYVDRADQPYSGNVFHRSVNAGTFDIIQSGGYSGDGAALNTFPTEPAIVNAPGIPNDRGTLAYARTSFPDSARAGWYINAQDSPGLDVGDSYAVFGRATDASLPVIDTIFGYPTISHDVPIDGSPTTTNFATFPTTDGLAPSSPAPANLIVVNSISRTPALSYSLDLNSAPLVALATIVDNGSGPELEITPLTVGTTELELTVTDIDGNMLPATHTVTVQGTYAIWIADQAIAPKPEGPLDNPGGGPLNNLQSYAFGGVADDASDDAGRSPSPTTVEVESVAYDALCFYHRKLASDLVYTVQSTTDLSSWDTVWTSADGNDAAGVVSVVDDGDFWKLTVRRDTPSSADDIVLFRVSVTLAGG